MPEATDYYMPVLRWKRGEQVALQNLEASTKNVVDPIIVVEPLDYDPSMPGGNDAAFDAQLDQLAASVVRYWPSHQASIDLGRTDAQARYGAASSHYVTELFNRLRVDDVVFRPVVSLDSDAAFRAAVADVAKHDERGVTIRLNIFEYDSAVNSDLDDLLNDIEVGHDEVDLVIDCAQNVLPTPVISRIVTAAIGSLAHLAQWRTLTLASGSFPESLSALAVGTQVIPRNCLNLWQAVRAAAPARLPGLGDYAIIHPEPLEVSGFMNPSASVKYTVDDGWLILRGQGTRTPGTGGFAQFTNHARTLVAHSLYCGAGFSWGDQQIADVAAGTSGSGNLETWVRIGVNHHLEFVVDRLSSYPGP